MGVVSEVNIGAAIAYTQDRERQREVHRRMDNLPAFAMADCMVSGLSGRALADALRHHFPNAKRADVYLAAGLAVAILQADLTVGQMEIAALFQEAVRA